MTRTPRALAVVDAGAATTAVAVLGRLGDRWRLLGSLAAPAGVPEGELLGVLAARVRTADPELASEVGLDPRTIEAIPWLASRSPAPRTIAALGASRRSVAIIEGVLARTSWRVEAASTETHDPREMTELVLRPGVSAVLAAVGDPPGPDERPALDDLAGLIVAAARRRPEIQVVVGDGIRARRTWVEGLGPGLPGDPERIVGIPPIGTRRSPDEPQRAVLDGLLADPLAGRGALRAVASSLADLLDRRVEILEVGHDGGARVLAAPGVAGADPSSTAVLTARGALIPVALGEELVDQVLAWTTGSLDRHRMADRLRDLRSAPWSDPTGDGARLRLAAARAALVRIAGVTPELSGQPAPDLTILAGGCFAAAPAAAVALAAADTIRRAGATQLAMDPARLLGPIGTIEDPLERRALLADILDDLLVPLGSIVMAAGARARRDDAPIGSLTLDEDGSASRHELAAGDLAFIGLPPGARAWAGFEFRTAVRLGGRARRVGVPVTGGLAGLLVDLRDVPLRLPERRDRRRALLAAWSAMAWPADDR